MKTIFFYILFTVIAVPLLGQGTGNRFTYNRRVAKGNTFLEKQWWIGIKSGVNYSSPQVMQRYDGIIPVNYSRSSAAKKYDRYSRGEQFCIEATFTFRSFSLTFQPSYIGSRFDYATQYSWSNPEVPSDLVEMRYDQINRVSHLSFPLLVKYEYPINRVALFAQGGFFYNTLLSGQKSVAITGTDYSAGGESTFTTAPIHVGATDLFAKSHYGIIAGGGIMYTTGNIRLSLDLQYRHGLSLFNRPESRYQNDRLNGIGDAMDDLHIRNFSVSAGILFPLRFISSGFKSSEM